MTWNNDPPDGKQLRIDLATSFADAVYYQCGGALPPGEIASRACGLAESLACEIERRGWMTREEEQP